jgi:exosortase
VFDSHAQTPADRKKVGPPIAGCVNDFAAGDVTPLLTPAEIGKWFGSLRRFFVGAALVESNEPYRSRRALSTLSPHPSASALVGVNGSAGHPPAADAALAAPPLTSSGPVYFGLGLATWVKIGVLGLLMVALYRFNLARLWAKTNPFSGQGNWEHAIFIPLVGIYYLYVWRDELLSPKSTATAATPAAEAWTLPGIWAFMYAVPAVLAMAGVAFLLPDPFLFDPQSALLDVLKLPLTLIAVAVVLLSAAAAAFVYLRRDELKYPRTQLWLTNAWRGLGCWLLAYVPAAGTLYFFRLLVPGTPVTAARYVLGVAFLLALGWVVWTARSEDWRRYYDRVLARSSGWFGGFILAWGILYSLLGIWPIQNDFIKDIGMVVSLFGLVLLTAGWRVMAIAWFPIVYLFCAIPWPDLTYSQLAMPLQMLAAKVGVFVLQATGVEAGQTGTKIWFFDAARKPQVLNVEEACAGLKSLMTFVSIGAAIAFLSGRLLWQKLAIAFMAVPTAILCNTGRISGQGLLHRYVSEEWSRDFAHGFVGLVLIFPGFGLIWLSAWVVDHLFIEESDDKPAAKKAATVVRAKPVASVAVVAPAAVAVPVATTSPAAAAAVPSKGPSAPMAVATSPRPATAPKPVAPVAKPAVPMARPAAAAARPTAAAVAPAGAQVAAASAAVSSKPAAPVARPTGVTTGPVPVRTAARVAGAAQPSVAQPTAVQPAAARPAAAQPGPVPIRPSPARAASAPPAAAPASPTPPEARS